MEKETKISSVQKTEIDDEIFFSIRKILLDSNKKRELLVTLLRKLKKINKNIKMDEDTLFNLANEKLKTDNKYSLLIAFKEDENKTYVYFKETPYILKWKNKYEAEIRSVFNINKIKIAIFIFIVSLILPFSLIINDSYETYTSYYFSIIFFFLTITILSKFDFKIFFVLVPIVFIVKYILYNYNYEIYQYYSPSIHFDMHILFISMMILFLLFSVQFLLFFFYILMEFLNATINAIEMIVRLKKYQYIFYIISITVCIYYFLLFIKFETIITTVFWFFVLCVIFASKLDIEAEPFYEKLNKKTINLDFLFNFERLYNVLSKNFKGLEHISSFSYFRLTKNFKIFYIFSIFIWAAQILIFHFYLNSFEYHKNFFKENNGYCSNLDYDDLILKTSKSNKAILMVGGEYESGYLIHFGSIQNISLPFIKEFSKKYNQDFYYLYEVECENIYD